MAHKTLTKRYLTSLFRRGKADAIPMDYIMSEAKKVLGDSELEKIEPMLKEMIGQGEVEMREDMYHLAGEPLRASSDDGSGDKQELKPLQPLNTGGCGNCRGC